MLQESIEFELLTQLIVQTILLYVTHYYQDFVMYIDLSHYRAVHVTMQLGAKINVTLFQSITQVFAKNGLSLSDILNFFINFGL